MAKAGTVAKRSATSRDPKWLTAARRKIGTREAPGPANNPTILGWAKRLGTRVLGILYNADDVPWCGVFVAHCLDEAGIAAPPLAVRAKSWAAWGANLRPERLAPGAVLVFEREGAATSAPTSARMGRAIMCWAATRATPSRSRGSRRAA